MNRLHEYECPACGGMMEFDTGTQTLLCPYCGQKMDAEQYEAAETQEEFWQAGDGMQVYTCGSCGGEIIGDGSMGSSSCPYCGNHVLARDQFSGDRKPQGIIPFKLDKKAAMEHYQRHISGRAFLPKTFRDQNHIEQIRGIYVPFWIYDVKARGEVTFAAEKDRVIRSDADSRDIRHEVYEITRAGSAEFQGVPADGSRKMDDALMESIEPFDTAEEVPFRPAYLAGFLADRYDVDEATRRDRAAQRLKASMEALLKEQVTGYDTLWATDTQVELTDCRSRYVLYPVWLLNTTWKGKQFTFAMNGQTGKMVGDLPVDQKACRFWTLLLGALFTGGIFGFILLMISLA